MILCRKWAMPNSNTFEIKPIKTLIHKYLKGLWIDGFSNNSRLAQITNDIDKECNADYHLDALDFFKRFDDASVDGVLFDPPYSPRQVSECYKKLYKTVNFETTQSTFWSNIKQEIARIVKPGGHVITCSWNSGGVGKSLGFKQVEILLVGHGGWHNDTIVVVEEKEEITTQPTLFTLNLEDEQLGDYE